MTRPTLTPNEMRLAGELLDRAHHEFSNHGCNDFDRPSWFPEDEWHALDLKMHTANGDPEEHRPSDMGDDWVLMMWLGQWLQEAGGAPMEDEE